MSVRTFIVDDTRLARQEMGTLLAAHADVHVVVKPTMCPPHVRR